MKKTKMFLTVAAFLLAAFSSLQLLAAAADKEVTLTGLAVCGKCVLHQSDTCQNVLLVVKDDKTNEYWLAQNDVSKDFHQQICTTDGEKVTVTGTLSKDNGKRILTASKIEPVK